MFGVNILMRDLLPPKICPQVWDWRVENNKVREQMVYEHNLHRAMIDLLVRNQNCILSRTYPTKLVLNLIRTN